MVIQSWTNSSLGSAEGEGSQVYFRLFTLALSDLLKTGMTLFPEFSCPASVPGGWASLEIFLPTSWRSNQSVLKEISPEYSLEGLMLRLKL